MSSTSYLDDRINMKRELRIAFIAVGIRDRSFINDMEWADLQALYKLVIGKPYKAS